MSLTIQRGPVAYRVDSFSELEALFPDADERRRLLLEIADSSRQGQRARAALGTAVARALCGEVKDASRHEQ